jgi:HSP20 family protein
MPDVCRAGRRRRRVIRCRPGPVHRHKHTDDSYLVDINLPGVIAEDLNSEVRDNQVRISGQVKDREHTGVLGRRGRHVGDFGYLLAPPAEVDPNKVEAKPSDGLLTEPVARPPRISPRRIEITS